jgi:hypothetical protein
MKTTKELIIADITAKVEAKLASQKVELASINDLKKIIENGKSIYKRGVQFVDKRDALKKEAITVNGDAKGLLTGGQKLINEFISSAKELGINVNQIKEVQEAIDILGPLDTIEKQTSSFIK